MIQVAYYLIYLTSLTEPKLSLIFVENKDSLSYYDGNQYVTKKILHSNFKSTYTVEGGYIHVKKKYIKIYSFSDTRKPLVYKIRKRVLY